MVLCGLLVGVLATSLALPWYAIAQERFFSFPLPLPTGTFEEPGTQQLGLGGALVLFYWHGAFVLWLPESVGGQGDDSPRLRVLWWSQQDHFGGGEAGAIYLAAMACALVTLLLGCLVCIGSCRLSRPRLNLSVNHPLHPSQQERRQQIKHMQQLHLQQYEESASQGTNPEANSALVSGEDSTSGGRLQQGLFIALKQVRYAYAVLVVMLFFNVASWALMLGFYYGLQQAGFMGCHQQNEDSDSWKWWCGAPVGYKEAHVDPLFMQQSVILWGPAAGWLLSLCVTFLIISLLLSVKAFFRRYSPEYNYYYHYHLHKKTKSNHYREEGSRARRHEAAAHRQTERASLLGTEEDQHHH